MKETADSILSAPLANVLVLAGIVFLLVAVLGTVAGKVDPGKAGRIAAGGIGAILLVVGLSMHLVVAKFGESGTSAKEQAAAQQTATEEARQQDAERARQRAADEARRKVAEETRRKAAEEARRKAADEARRKVANEARPACSISGLVFDSDSNRPLSAVWIDLYHGNIFEKRGRRLKAGVATTGPDGKFSINCNWVKRSQFPLAFAVRHRNWVATRLTGPLLDQPGRHDIKIAIPMSEIALKRR